MAKFFSLWLSVLTHFSRGYGWSWVGQESQEDVEVGPLAQQGSPAMTQPGPSTSTPSQRLAATDWSMDSDEYEDDHSAGEQESRTVEESGLGANAIFPTRGNLFLLESSASSEDSFQPAKNASGDIFEFLVEVFKYVDDTTIVEAIDLSEGIRHLTTRMSSTMSKARYTELLAGQICTRSEEIGMRVNNKKTQLLLISPPNGYTNEAFITLQGETIKCSDSLKLLGFMFGRDPGIGSHVLEIQKSSGRGSGP